MLDNYDKVQKARSLVPYDVYDEHYAVFFFLALRYLGVGLLESIRNIRHELRENKISFDYSKIFVTKLSAEDPESYEFLNYIGQKILNKRMKEGIELYVKETGEKPKSNLGQMIWAEVIFRNPHNGLSFRKLLSEVKREIVNPDEG